MSRQWPRPPPCMVIPYPAPVRSALHPTWSSCPHNASTSAMLRWRWCTVAVRLAALLLYEASSIASRSFTCDARAPQAGGQHIAQHVQTLTLLPSVQAWHLSSSKQATILPMFAYLLWVPTAFPFGQRFVCLHTPFDLRASWRTKPQ